VLTVTEALKRRISTREFRPQPLAEQLVREILDVARWAPSGGNLQPWKVIAVAGAERAAVIELARRTYAAEGPNESTDRPVYPQNLWEPYRTRRYELGEDMYALLAIPRSDRAGGSLNSRAITRCSVLQSNYFSRLTSGWVMPNGHILACSCSQSRSRHWNAV